MFIEEIMADTQMEDYQTEFKGKLNREDVVGWLKTIAGFANADGGDMYIGVEDKNHKLIGYERNEADKERNYFNNQVNEHLVPRPPMKIAANESLSSED
jgi:predicted HTH transcriptional regulator